MVTQKPFGSADVLFQKVLQNRRTVRRTEDASFASHKDKTVAKRERLPI